MAKVRKKPTRCYESAWHEKCAVETASQQTNKHRENFSCSSFVVFLFFFLCASHSYQYCLSWSRSIGSIRQSSETARNNSWRWWCNVQPVAVCETASVHRNTKSTPRWRMTGLAVCSQESLAPPLQSPISVHPEESFAGAAYNMALCEAHAIVLISWYVTRHLLESSRFAAEQYEHNSIESRNKVLVVIVAAVVQTKECNLSAAEIEKKQKNPMATKELSRRFCW